MIKGCVPVDADTFDIPAIIEIAETRARVHGLPMPTFGHRQKIRQRPGEAPRLLDRHARRPRQGHPAVPDSARRGHPDTTAQARRLAETC